MVVVTGRRALDIPALLQMENMPEIWGSHGLERIQLDGTSSLVPIEGSDREALAEARVFLDREGIAEHAEMKVGGIAVHWRGFSKAQSSAFRALQEESCSRLQSGRTSSFFLLMAVSSCG